MGTRVTDNFNRADNNDLGASWTVVSTMVRFGIVSNAAVPSDLTGNDDGEYYSADTPPDDQYALAKTTINMNTSSTGFNGAGPAIRMATGATTFYCVVAIDERMKIMKGVAGSFTHLGSFLLTWADGDTLYIEAQGSALKAKLNGTEQISVTDSAIASGRYGVVHGTAASVSAASLDDWEGGDFAAADILFAQGVM